MSLNQPCDKTGKLPINRAAKIPLGHGYMKIPPHPMAVPIKKKKEKKFYV